MLLAPFPDKLFFNCKKNSRKIKEAIAIHKKLWYNDSHHCILYVKIDLNCNEYLPKMQELSSRKILMAQAMQKVSEIERITLLHFRLQGVDYRKKLVSRELIYFDFPLVRVLMLRNWPIPFSCLLKAKTLKVTGQHSYG